MSVPSNVPDPKILFFKMQGVGEEVVLSGVVAFGTDLYGFASRQLQTDVKAVADDDTLSVNGNIEVVYDFLEACVGLEGVDNIITHWIATSLRHDGVVTAGPAWEVVRTTNGLSASPSDPTTWAWRQEFFRAWNTIKTQLAR